MLPNNVCHLLLLLVEEEEGGRLKAGTRMMEKETFRSKIENPPEGKNWNQIDDEVIRMREKRKSRVTT